MFQNNFCAQESGSGSEMRSTERSTHRSQSWFDNPVWVCSHHHGNVTVTLVASHNTHVHYLTCCACYESRYLWVGSHMAPIKRQRSPCVCRLSSEGQLPSVLRCWHRSGPCDCRMESFSFSVVVSYRPPLVPGYHTQFLSEEEGDGVLGPVKLCSLMGK